MTVSTVSMVKRCHETETHPITFDEIWTVTRSGAHGLKEKITQIRNRYEVEKDITGSAEKAKKAVADLKLQLPGFLPSGSFKERQNAALERHSGILCADLDGVGDALPVLRKFFQESPFVHAVAVSPSGDGLKVFFNIEDDPLRHEDSYRAVRNYVLESTGFEIDEKCKDPARICFFTYDPDLWLREGGGIAIPPALPIPRAKTTAVPSPDLNGRELIATRLLGELSLNPEKNGYFVRCPGEAMHSNKTGEKHTILYLSTVPTLVCQHQSCLSVVEAFNKVLRSEIGKAEWKPPTHSVNGTAPASAVPEEEVPWIEILNKSAVNSKELSGMHLVPRPKLLGDWCCEGDLGFFYGPRGAGKTWFTIGFAQAVTTGGTFGDWTAPVASKVLYIDGEMPPDSMKARCEGLNAVNENLLIVNHTILFDRTEKTLNITNPMIQGGLTQYCVANSIKVLLLDNLSTLGVGMKENDADSWELVNTWLLGLRRLGIAVVIIHHAGRSGHMRGTSRREDNVFWIINIDEVRKDSEEAGAKFITRFTKASRNTPNEIPDYEWHFKPDSTTGLVTIDYKMSHSLTVFRAVIESGVTKPSEIAKVMRVEDYQVSRMAHKAIGLGWLERVNRGEYALIEGK